MSDQKAGFGRNRKNNEVAVKDQAELSTQQNVPRGFEDESDEDLVMPRIKVINALSPERADGKAVEGDIINSLTFEKLNDKVFIPIKKFNSHILWRDRADGGGIDCWARDGKVGQTSDGQTLLCRECKKCEFDNSKQGRDAIPTCTKYINFLGVMAGTQMPIILSFSKTNFNDGKKLYSAAKVTMQDMFNHGYTLEAKKMSKGGNTWFNIGTKSAGPTTDEDRVIAAGIYDLYKDTVNSSNFDLSDGQVADTTPTNAGVSDEY